MARFPSRLPGREIEAFEDKVILSTPTDQQGELKIYAGTTGEKALSIYRGTKELFSIDVTTDRVRLFGATDKFIQIGDATAVTYLPETEDNLFVSGRLEVASIEYHRGDVRFYSEGTFVDHVPAQFGYGKEARILWCTHQTNDALFIETDVGTATASGHIIIAKKGAHGVDYGFPATANPILYVVSGDTTVTDEYVRIFHNQTDGTIECGSGKLHINYTGQPVDFFGGTTANPVITVWGYDTGAAALKRGTICVSAYGTFALAADTGEWVAIRGDGGIDLNYLAEGEVNCYRGAGTGENLSFRVWGRNAADTAVENISLRWGDGVSDVGFISTTQGELRLRGNNGNDLNTTAGVGMVIPTGAATAPVAGSMYFDPATNTLYCHNGTTWVGVVLS